jgi:hypothetical protein
VAPARASLTHRAFALTRLLLLAATFLGLFTGAPSVQAQTVANGCAPGQSPGFPEQFAPLTGRIGVAMGTPFTCAYPDPAGTGDVHVLTDYGLAYWRQSTGVLSYTINDIRGQAHWALVDDQMMGWIGDSIDPPPDAVDLTGCQDVFSLFDEWPGYYTWGGFFRLFGPFDGQPLLDCEAGHSGDVWLAQCFLRAGQPVAIDGGAPCTNALWMEQVDAVTLEAGLRNGAAAWQIRHYRWTSPGLHLLDNYNACHTEPPLRIPDELWGGDYSEFCGYPRPTRPAFSQSP